MTDTGLFRLVIIGASGHGKVAIDVARACLPGCELMLADDGDCDPEVLGVPVVGNTDTALELISAHTGFFIAIGNNAVRAAVSLRLSRAGARIISLVHPQAIVSTSAQFGDGTLVMPGAIINAEARLAEGVIVNTGATVDHDCQLSRYVHLAPGVNLAGGVCVGEYGFIGIGSQVIQQVRIGAQSIVGAGSTVISDLPDQSTAVGCPAKIIKIKNKKVGVTC
ncbi:acetyltransferase [Alteromonas sp. ASW11-19]|uniref:Acetyltransferase n=1 Tax=Alteromonas salexigens TaxID=2982530 RepID=A0ABT2VK62_9ALTE|nr:acetyltransferase [Alteromonas salexigens]MCU7553656.1 acetyltransferase [Alteromonas salexigens]